MKEKRLSLIIKANNSRYEIKEKIQKGTSKISEIYGSGRKYSVKGNDQSDAS